MGDTEPQRYNATAVSSELRCLHRTSPTCWDSSRVKSQKQAGRTDSWRPLHRCLPLWCVHPLQRLRQAQTRHSITPNALFRFGVLQHHPNPSQARGYTCARYPESKRVHPYRTHTAVSFEAQNHPSRNRERKRLFRFKMPCMRSLLLSACCVPCCRRLARRLPRPPKLRGFRLPAPRQGHEKSMGSEGTSIRDGCRSTVFSRRRRRRRRQRRRWRSGFAIYVAFDGYRHCLDPPRRCQQAGK